jgi:hypothetical protein
VVRAESLVAQDGVAKWVKYPTGYSKCEKMKRDFINMTQKLVFLKHIMKNLIRNNRKSP